MSPNLESPLKSQVPALLLRRLFGAGSGAGAARRDEAPPKQPRPSPPPAGRRRVFVQTESGCVLGMDLDRGDNAHTVKRRLQLAFNVPTGGTSLTFGDRVLENDLSSVRHDSPLLLTRNSIHRSCSTPCLCPVSKDFEQKDSSGLVEILGSSSGSVKLLVDDVATGIRSGLDPVPIDSGLGGSYYFRNVDGDRVAIVKPTDEEPFAPNNPKGFTGRALGQPGLKKSVRVGETGFREVAAYLLDHENFANVPATALVKITHSVFNVNRPMNGGAPAHDHKQQNITSKIASFQQFIAHDFDASDHGTSSFPVAAVHRIGILDIRIFNTDRHGGNVLVRKLDSGTGRFGCQTELFPIDHGLCLPENLEDPYFEWIHWAQASIPFSEEELEYIRNIDPIRDATMLRKELPMIREACLRVLILCTIFLKEAATSGLCLAEIGEMMTREFRGMEEEPSKLEVVCMEARRKVAEWEPFSPGVEQGEDMDFQFSMDVLGGGYSDVIRSPRFHCSGMKGSNFRNPLTKLVESMNEDNDEEEDRKELSMHSSHRIPSSEFNTPSVHRTTSLNSSSTHALNRSADEQLPSSMCFVRLPDMSAEEWHVFVEKFQELLKEALDECKAAGAQRMKQRLGTSCKF